MTLEAPTIPEDIREELETLGAAVLDTLDSDEGVREASMLLASIREHASALCELAGGGDRFHDNGALQLVVSLVLTRADQQGSLEQHELDRDDSD